MNKEEIEAIKIVEDIAFVRGIRQDVEGEIEDLGAIEDVLRLIDKLQKENEEYQELTENLRGKYADLRDKLDKLNSENEELKKGKNKY